ncbi:MAG: hypothetical protein ACLPY5_12135 [Candidatus Bathyarchaeia archaeon]
MKIDSLRHRIEKLVATQSSVSGLLSTGDNNYYVQTFWRQLHYTPTEFMEDKRLDARHDRLSDEYDAFKQDGVDPPGQLHVEWYAIGDRQIKIARVITERIKHNDMLGLHDRFWPEFVVKTLRCRELEQKHVEALSMGEREELLTNQQWFMELHEKLCYTTPETPPPEPNEVPDVTPKISKHDIESCWAFAHLTPTGQEKVDELLTKRKANGRPLPEAEIAAKKLLSVAEQRASKEPISLKQEFHDKTLREDALRNRVRFRSLSKSESDEHAELQDWLTAHECFNLETGKIGPADSK